MKTGFLCSIFLLLFAGMATAQQDENLPKIIEKNGRHALLVDGRPFFILGGQAHNSSAWPAMMPGVWLAVKQMNANTLEVPVYWEQIEPQQGSFNFSLINTLLIQARQHQVRLVLLWFATWKNGSSHYMPVWMKKDAALYPNIINRMGQPVDSPDPNNKAAMEADTRAFAAVMRHLKQADPQHTVIMVQVENESGSYGSVRNYSARSQKLFEGQVPAEMLKPAVLNQLHVPVVSGGNWQQIFGDRADEYFQAWSIASYVGKVAAAGKAEYPLPLYVNAALRDPFTNPMANVYESGGPTDNVIPIWKAAAPAIDLLAPDIYLTGSKPILKVIDLYNRPDNALMVPEFGLLPANAKYMFTLLAGGGIGFSPFGIDDVDTGEKPGGTAIRMAPFSREYKTAAPMRRELARWAFDGKIKAVVEQEDQADQTIDLGAWQAVVSFTPRRGTIIQPAGQSDGKLMIVKQEENKFLLIGAFCHVTFKPLGKDTGKAWQYLRVEEGSYINGAFTATRIRNGDETDWGGPGFDEIPAVLQVTLALR